MTLFQLAFPFKKKNIISYYGGLAKSSTIDHDFRTVHATRPERSGYIIVPRN